MPIHQGYCAHTPRLLCPCTKTTAPTHQGYCARTPRLLCPHTKTAVPVHQDCCARAPRLLCPCTKATVPVRQGCCAHPPRLLCPCTKLGTRPNLPDSWAHQACRPLVSGRCVKPRRLASSSGAFVPFVVPKARGRGVTAPAHSRNHGAGAVMPYRSSAAVHPSACGGLICGFPFCPICGICDICGPSEPGGG